MFLVSSGDGCDCLCRCGMDSGGCRGAIVGDANAGARLGFASPLTPSSLGFFLPGSGEAARMTMWVSCKNIVSIQVLQKGQGV